MEQPILKLEHMRKSGLQECRLRNGLLVSYAHFQNLRMMAILERHVAMIMAVVVLRVTKGFGVTGGEQVRVKVQEQYGAVVVRELGWGS